MRNLAASAPIPPFAPDAGTRELTSPVTTYLERVRSRYTSLAEGEVASYIPELARADPQWFGIALATTDGHVYEVGDTGQPFTIQSISKALTYGLALEDRGVEAVLARIGVEPTGDAFNSISLAPDTGRPLNPMINAGAIAASSLIAGRSEDDKLARLLAVYSLYAGRTLAIDQSVYASERATGHRNRAIGHMLRNFGIIEGDPEPALDLYFRQCSISIDCRDLSLIAATLANDGVNPLTRERAVRSGFVERILSVMTTCGMYDSAGEWMYGVGLPAKSGVSGGIMVVLPGQFGIGVFSPRLDAHGNSVRGVRVCQDLSRELELHLVRVARSSRSAIRAHYTLAAVRSRRHRPEGDAAILADAGRRAAVYELQGDLLYAAMEVVVRSVIRDCATASMVVLDFRRVTSVSDPAAALTLELFESLHGAGRTLLFVGLERRHPRLLRYLQERIELHEGHVRVQTFADLDSAIEWCEHRLLEGIASSTAPATRIELADHALCRGLDADTLSYLDRTLERRSFAAGEYIVRAGSEATGVYLLVDGEVRITVQESNDHPRRLVTLAAGTTFGELAAIGNGVRSADVRATTDVECRLLSSDLMRHLSQSRPQVALVLLGNMLRNALQTVSRLSREVAALSG